MKNQTTILLVVAGACGLVAVLGIKQYLAAKGEQEVVETVEVLVAATPIVPGARLDELNTKFVTVEKATAPEGAVTSLEQIQERSLKVARSPGDWIVMEQLGSKGGTGASVVIPPGMRVATIPVDATTNHSGMLQPGNRIDLLLSYKWKDPATRNQVLKVRPLLQYIEVFAVGDQVYGVSTAGGDSKQARNISLLVDTEQMMTLQMAQDKGDISTVLRSNEDKEEVTIGEISEDSLDGNSRGGVSEISANGFFDYLKDPELTAFALPEEENQPNVMDDLASAFSSDEKNKDENHEDEYWTMTIYSQGTGRRERVNLLSEEPLYDPPPSSPLGPAASGPVSGDPSPEQTLPLPEGLNVDFGDSGFGEQLGGLVEEMGF